ALTNRGGATAAEVMALARYVQGRVRREFGIDLAIEPTLVGSPG
ncbi:MAG: UDP-N-acetylenolpyruvoylglucosamine reductase, partial [bacterium]|nr:UDP-N-acetylenolpyruvoylglucosamine reductase [bacterium]